ncbi:MAG: CDGSH iron-sulfur domain-containing protein, partial [Myxococcota bacterium]
ECGRAKGDLFVGGRDPWCDPDVSSDDDVADVCERCPTGALTYQAKAEGGPAESADDENRAFVAYNGPLYLRGEQDIDAEASAGTRFRAALCRCGESKNKPFCDNSHLEAGFVDYGAVGESGDGNEAEGGELKVARAKDGPLLLNGNFAIVAASGRMAWRGTKAALCRCGKSKNKPFCDGAHKAAGFTAD